MTQAMRITSIILTLLITACSAQPFNRHAALLHAVVQTTGRTEYTSDGWLSTWPAVAWRTAFSGQAIGIDTQDRAGYHVEIDGAVEPPVPPSPVRITTWYRNLSAGRHTIEVIRTGATPKAPGTLFGFTLATGGQWLAIAPPPKRQMLLIGDSIATGYGDLSNSTQCPDDVLPLTDASQSFGVLAARTLHADWQLNAMDGIGLVRNWQGIWRGTTFDTYALRNLQNDPASVASDPHWHPQVAVLAIGSNDLATPLAADEPWTDTSLRSAFITAYDRLLSGVRRDLGPHALIIVMIDPSTHNPMTDIARSQVDARRSAGDDRLFILEFPVLERTGCFWHPSLLAHRQVGILLSQFIEQHAGFKSR
jgi:lysophospholipase L1-like esterase